MYVSEKPLGADSFEELALPLFDRLYNFAHWLTQNREEAEDLVQETFAKALKGFSSFSARHQFSSLDVPNLAQHFSYVPHRIKGHGDGAFRPGRR